MPFDTEQTFEKTDKTGDADPAMQRKVVSIVGPTASGKTGLGIAVAKALARKGEQAEIINADAYQMYRGMDIGTAKASLEEQAQVRHHLIDIIEPDDAMSVARFQELAREKIAELQAKGVRPILVGGSGLYARAAIDDISFPGTDPQIRMALEEPGKNRRCGRAVRRAESQGSRSGGAHGPAQSKAYHPCAGSHRSDGTTLFGKPSALPVRHPHRANRSRSAA